MTSCQHLVARFWTNPRSGSDIVVAELRADFNASISSMASFMKFASLSTFAFRAFRAAGSAATADEEEEEFDTFLPLRVKWSNGVSAT